MADLTDYHVVDGVDDVLAVQYNRIIDSTVRGELSNIESLTANKTLMDSDFALQIFTPTAARDVTLPAIVAANHPFYIVNASATYALTVKNAGGTTIGTVAVSSSGSFASDGVAWHSFGTGGVSWVEASGWSYASATAINVSSGAENIYSVGDKLRFQNNASGTYLYAYVISIASTTQLTVAGDSVPNATITNAGYSKSQTPLNFPIWFPFTPIVAQGSSTNISKTVTSSSYSISGRIVLWQYSLNMTGTGQGSNRITVTLPITGTYTSYDLLLSSCQLYDASTNTSAYGNALFNGAGNVVLFSPEVGVTPAITIASGDLITGSIQYRI